MLSILKKTDYDKTIEVRHILLKIKLQILLAVMVIDNQFFL